jgi:hypothetical protein
MSKSLKATLAIIALLLVIGWLRTNIWKDSSINEGRITSTHFYGIEKTDPNREVKTYDFKTNHFTYKDEVQEKPIKKKNVKHYIYIRKKTIDDMIDDKIEEYIEDNKEEINEELNDK